MSARTLFLLALLFGVALTLQILACALWNNWWPLLTGIVYVLVPMPYLFFGGGAAGSDYYASAGGGDSDWADVGKFLTGMTVVGAIGIPVVLAHAALIQPVQLALAIPSAILLGITLVLYDYFSRRDDDVW